MQSWAASNRRRYLASESLMASSERDCLVMLRACPSDFRDLRSEDFMIGGKGEVAEAAAARVPPNASSCLSTICGPFGFTGLRRFVRSAVVFVLAIAASLSARCREARSVIDHAATTGAGSAIKVCMA